MDGTVGGSDPPIGSRTPLPLSEPLSVSSMSLSPPPTPKPVPVPIPAPSIEALDDAMSGTSISVEAPQPKAKKTKRSLESYREYYAERERGILAARKQLIEKLRNGTIDPALYGGPRKQVKVPRTREEPDKLYPLFQCDRGHCTCIRCYEHHSKKCRYCLTTKGSVVSWKKGEAAESTFQYSCHKGRGWVIPKEEDFFCPDSSCQFCGPLDSVLVHITVVHSMIIQNFSYGEVIRIPLNLVGKYVVLRAEDGTAFVLRVDDQKHGKIMSVVCAEQLSFCKTRFTLELSYDLPPVVRSWLRGQHWTPLYYASNPRVKPWDIVGSSIVKYDKNLDVSRIANADSNSIIRSRISSSNLGCMHVDNKGYAVSVPWAFHDSYCGPKMWYGDLILSISSPSDAN